LFDSSTESENVLIEEDIVGISSKRESDATKEEEEEKEEEERELLYPCYDASIEELVLTDVLETDDDDDNEDDEDPQVSVRPIHRDYADRIFAFPSI